jgi:metal-responsive CopG/Arc/MetJ family transcriptional regulator
MKTAISIPDPLFKAAEKLARQRKISRSELYSQALSEFLSKHERERIKAQISAVAEEVDTSLDPALIHSQAKVLSKDRW